MTMLALIVTLTLSILVAPCASDAQQTANVYRIGILAGSAPDLRVQRGHEALQQSWRALRYQYKPQHKRCIDVAEIASYT